MSAMSTAAWDSIPSRAIFPSRVEMVFSREKSRMAIFSSVTSATSETVPFLLCGRGNGAELGQGLGVSEAGGIH